MHDCIFFFNDTTTTEIYTLSLHDALPISALLPRVARTLAGGRGHLRVRGDGARGVERGSAREPGRSEEHTSELQPRQYLVCRLLLEKNKLHALRRSC